MGVTLGLRKAIYSGGPPLKHPGVASSRVAAALLALLPAICGCSATTPHISSMTFAPGAMEVVGPASGESTSDRFLCAINFGDAASVVAATANAVKKARADALINTVVDDERGTGFLYCWQTIRVSGTAVRFSPRVIARGVPATNSGNGPEDSLQDMERKVLGGQ